MVKNSQPSEMTNIGIREGNWNDFDSLLGLLVKFYTEYEPLSVHLGIRGEEIKDFQKSRLKKYLKKGVCSVAEINGKIEGAFIGRIQQRNENYEADYLQMPENFQVVEKVVTKLEEDIWNQIPPKFNSVCFMEYGIVTPRAQGFGIGDSLLKEACRLCVDKGTFVASSSSLIEKTAQWMLERGFAVVKRLALDEFKDQQGRPFFEGRPEKTATLLVAFFEDTTTFLKSKI